MKCKKYGEVFLLILVLLFIFSAITTLLGYYNVFTNKVIQPMSLFLTLLTFFLGGIFLGVRSEKRGWLEGLKLGLTTIFLFFLIRYLGFDQGMNLKGFLYYLLLLASPMLGSMIGINKRKEN